MTTDIRVRFAPSPTGYLHIGSARTALFNWLYARKHGGTYILRVEDTDKQRSTEESTRSILEGLAWIGLDWDEGPYYQSSYDDAHRAAALRLVEEGKAYRDFTPKGEIDDREVKEVIAERARAQGDAKPVNPFRDLDPAESHRRAGAGEPFAVRLKVPDAGVSTFHDAVYGVQEVDFKTIEDLVLLKSDGSPLYNLSVVVDDIQMRITDVIRGKDHLYNTHKQLLLYRALGAEPPRFAHLPLIFAPDRSKLSKRKHGAVVSLTTYRDRGFVPEAFRNFLALLGWSPGTDEEILTLDDLVAKFSLEDVNKADAVFNFREDDPQEWTDAKGLWMNGEYISKILALDDLAGRVEGVLRGAGYWSEEYAEGGARRAWYLATVELLRARARTLEDFVERGRAYWSDDFPVDPKSAAKNLADARLRELLPALADRYAALEEFTHESTEAALRAHADAAGVKAGLLINAARTALTGSSVGPGMFDVIVAMGRDRTVARLRAAVELVVKVAGSQ
jgi:glutamyl-tRNA synthetase